MERPDLVLARGTIGTVDLVERIEVAAAAGFRGLGLAPEDYSAAREVGLGDAELRARLGDRGLTVVELQSVTGWAGDDLGRLRARTIEEGCYRVADALGGAYLMVTATTFAHDLDEAIERFADISDRAGAHGLKVVIEYIPWGPVSDARVAQQLVEGAGRDNAGVLVDSWHQFRGSGDADLLRRIRGDRIFGVQISDARREVVGTLYEDTVNERLNPGDGDIDLVGFVRTLDGMGVDVPYSVEVLSTRQRRLPPLEAATESARCTWRVMERARADTPRR